MSEPSIQDNRFFDHKRFGFQQVVVIMLCLVMNMLDGFDITAMAVVAADVGKEMQLTDDKLGFVFSFSLAGMMLGAMFLAPLSDVFGRRRIILISLVTVGLSVLLTAYAANISVMIALRFISGLGAGAMLASLATLSSEYSSLKFRALSVAVVTAGYPLGAMFTGVVATFLVPKYGWQSMFIAGGFAALLLSIVIFLLLPESLQFLCNRKPKNALQKVNKILQRFSMEEVSSLPQSQSQSDASKTQSITGNIKQLLQPKYKVKTITLWCSFMFSVCTLYFFLSWLPKVLINEGMTSQFARQAFIVLNLGGVVGIFLLGALATRWVLSNVVFIYLLLAGLLMLVFSAVAEQPTTILIFIAIIGLLLQGGFTGLYALAAKLYSSEIRTTGVGWAIGLGRLGAVFGPVVAGYLIAGGVSIEMNFVIFSIPVFIAAIGIVTLKIR